MRIKENLCRIVAPGALILFLALGCGGGGGGGASVSTPPAVAITSFLASPPMVTLGGAVKLTGVYTSGTGVITPGNLSAANGVPVSVAPVATTDYTLTVTDSTGTATKTATVTVVPATTVPVITTPAFLTPTGAATASVPAQTGSTFAWTITGGTFTGGGATASGANVTYVASAVGTLHLTCIATNAAGDASTAGSKDVTVYDFGLVSFTAAPATLTAGTGAILAATFIGATGTIDQGIGTIVSGGTKNVSPTATTTYTLTVTNSAGLAVTGTVTVTVVPAPVITSFTNNGPVASGAAGSLSAVFSGGTGTVDHGLGAITSGVPMTTGNLTAGATYLLTVTNAAGKAVTAKSTVFLTGSNIVAGTLRGLAAGKSITLSNNGADTLTLTANGSFTFPGTFGNGTPYDVAITTSPAGQACAVTEGAGLLNGQNALVDVICGPMPRGGIVPASAMEVARYRHTATRLANGKVLVAGGQNQDNYYALGTAELYDPLTRTWASAGNMRTPRCNHTATLLSNGKVLVAGGNSSGSIMAACELYDPATNTWATAGSFKSPRTEATATLLPSGKVLAMGGYVTGYTSVRKDAEVFDPVTNTWSVVANPAPSGQAGHTATVLNDGKILFVGGYGAFRYAGASIDTLSATAAVSLYDPATSTWLSTASMSTPRHLHTATLLANGDVLVAGGGANTSQSPTAIIYHTSTNTWTAAASMGFGRESHTATMLPNGKVMVVGSGSATSGSLESSTIEWYDPTGNTWSSEPLAGGTLATPRFSHTATQLADGNVLIVGGYVGKATASAELFDVTLGLVKGAFPINSYLQDYTWHTTTLLPNGKVLIAGGFSNPGSISSSTPIATTWVYNPVTQTMVAGDPLKTERATHTATLLPNGKVLVAGGIGQISSDRKASTEIYDPVTGFWTAGAAMGTPRGGATATLLPSGKVLMVGGTGIGKATDAEIYDPAANSWKPAGATSIARNSHTATLLPTGKVFVAGGAGYPNTDLATAEVYNPQTNAWSVVASMALGRSQHTATLLPNGKVLLAGGTTGMATGLTSAELYDPATDLWAAVPKMPVPRARHTATLLPTGKVLLASGLDYVGIPFDVCSRYNPETNTWEFNDATMAGNIPPMFPGTATMLPGGEILFCGVFWNLKFVEFSGAFYW
jgi:N-acetylneuraminic acid mutarotase